MSKKRQKDRNLCKNNEGNLLLLKDLLVFVADKLINMLS